MHVKHPAARACVATGYGVKARRSMAETIHLPVGHTWHFYGRRSVVALRCRNGHVLQELRKSLRLGAPPSNPVAAVAAVPMRALPDCHSMVGARRANRPSAFPMVAGPATAALVVIRPGAHCQKRAARPPRQADRRFRYLHAIHVPTQHARQPLSCGGVLAHPIKSNAATATTASLLIIRSRFPFPECAAV